MENLQVYDTSSEDSSPDQPRRKRAKHEAADPDHLMKLKPPSAYLIQQREYFRNHAKTFQATVPDQFDLQLGYAAGVAWEALSMEEKKEFEKQSLTAGRLYDDVRASRKNVEEMENEVEQTKKAIEEMEQKKKDLEVMEKELELRKKKIGGGYDIV